MTLPALGVYSLSLSLLVSQAVTVSGHEAECVALGRGCAQRRPPSSYWLSTLRRLHRSPPPPPASTAAPPPGGGVLPAAGWRCCSRPPRLLLFLGGEPGSAAAHSAPPAGPGGAAAPGGGGRGGEREEVWRAPHLSGSDLPPAQGGSGDGPGRADRTAGRQQPQIDGRLRKIKKRRLNPQTLQTLLWVFFISVSVMFESTGKNKQQLKT